MCCIWRLRQCLHSNELVELLLCKKPCPPSAMTSPEPRFPRVDGPVLVIQCQQTVAYVDIAALVVGHHTGRTLSPCTADRSVATRRTLTLDRCPRMFPPREGSYWMYLSSAGNDLRQLGDQVVLPSLAAFTLRHGREMSALCRGSWRNASPRAAGVNPEPCIEANMRTVQAGLLLRRELGAAVIRRQLLRE